MNYPAKTDPNLSEYDVRGLRAYVDFIEENGYLPDVRDFARAYGVESSSTAYARIRSLRKKGLPIYTRGEMGRDHDASREVFNLCQLFASDSAMAENLRLRAENSEIKNLKQNGCSVVLLRDMSKRLQMAEQRLRVAEARLQRVREWVAQADRQFGVDREWPHEWAGPVEGRLALLVASGEVTA